jgi:hypothetical protein
LFSEHAIPRWRGEPLHGRSLLIWTEQGLGDSLMTMRYLPRLKQLGTARLAVCCEEPLVRIMRAMLEVDQVFADTGVIGTEPRFDLQCPMMSLPLRMATRIETIPREVPYVRVTPELQQRWSAWPRCPACASAWSGPAAGRPPQTHCAVSRWLHLHRCWRHPAARSCRCRKATPPRNCSRTRAEYATSWISAAI